MIGESKRTNESKKSIETNVNTKFSHAGFCLGNRKQNSIKTVTDI